MADGVAILGGTGALGRGLAARWAAAGVEVTVASRALERAEDAVRGLHERLDGDVRLHAATNDRVPADAIVVLAVPFDGLAATVAPFADAWNGRIVVSAVNPLTFDAAGPFPAPIAEGSAAEAIAALLPGARVTAALHAVAGPRLRRLSEALDDDVPVVGDDEDAVREVAALIDRIDGLRPVTAGPLRLASALEGLSALLISINQRYRSHAGLRLSGLPEGSPDRGTT